MVKLSSSHYIGNLHLQIVHEVSIFQIQIQPPGSGRRASRILSSSFLETVNTSSHSDFMVINELGLGISRGGMNYGRLYQGKYIPPERTDGLLPECKEEECMNEEGINVKTYP